MPVAPCAFPVHLKDVFHPGEVSRQSCSCSSWLLISSCLPKLLKFWEMFTDLPAFWECIKQLKVNTHCTSFKFCVRRKASAVFQQGQLDTHIYHTKSLGQDRASPSELPPCSWGKNCISTAAYSYSSDTFFWFFDPIFILSLSEKAEVALQKQSCRREPQHRRHTKKEPKKSMQAYKGMWFHRGPRTKDQDAESSRDPNFLKHWGCSECCFECSPWINKTHIFWKRTEATELYFLN